MTEPFPTDHHPDICNYNVCGAPNLASPCPFVRDTQRAKFDPASGYNAGTYPVPTMSPFKDPVAECVHNWRQYYEAVGPHPYQPKGFFCTKCLDRHE